MPRLNGYQLDTESSCYSIDRLIDQFSLARQPPCIPRMSYCFRYSWTVGAWGACRATCGLSFQARRVKCLDKGVNRLSEDARCPTPKPPERQTCFAGPCRDHSFFTTSWGQCSKSCGLG